MAKKITPYFIMVTFLIVVFYDVYAYMSGGQEATISYLFITDWIYNYPFVTFCCGIIAGHLFWPLARKR